MSSKVTPIRPQAPGTKEPALISDVKAKALDSITDLLDGMFDGADDALFKMSEQAENNQNQGLYFDAMRALRLERPHITRTFIQELSAAISHGFDAPTRGPRGDLGLIPAADLEENVAIANMISKAGSLLREDLTQLQARLHSLAEKFPGTLVPNGLSPGGICHSFREAMAPVDFEIEIKLLIHKLFERSVLCELKPTYQLLHDLLKQNNVEPKRQRGAGELGGQPRVQGRGDRWSQRLQELSKQISPENQFGTGEVLKSLDNLDAFDFDSSVADTDPAELIDALLQLLRSTQTDSIPRSIQRDERQIIGMVTAMFNHASEQAELNSSSRKLLSRLRLPVMKTALIDPSLFRDADHPARRLVNEIATLNAIAPADDAPLYKDASALIERLVKEFERDPGVLEVVADEMQQLAGSYNGEGKSEVQRKARLERAKSVALLEIRQQSLGRKLPDSVKPFLLKAWGPLMAYSYLKHGLDSVQWRHAGEVLTRLLDAVYPPDADTDRDTLAREQATLLVLVRKQLRELSLGRARISELVESLEETFDDVLVNQATLPSEYEDEILDELATWSPEEEVFDDDGGRDATSAAFDVALAEPAAPESPIATPTEKATTEKAEPIPLPEEDAINLVKTVCVPGSWFQLYTGEERLRWLRFANYDDERSIVRFANRDNEVVYERGAVEFAQDLRAERSQPIYDRDDFERKLAQIIGMQTQTPEQE